MFNSPERESNSVKVLKYRSFTCPYIYFFWSLIMYDTLEPILDFPETIGDNFVYFRDRVK